MITESSTMPARTDPAAPATDTRASVGSRIAIGVMALLVIGEAMSLVARGAVGFSDIGVFYRTCVLLRDGVRDIYPRADAFTGWPISMPPLGFAIFQPFSVFGPRGSAIAWAALNIVLLLVSAVVVARLLRRTGDPRSARAVPWAVALLFALGAASIQVGQYSVLFVTCWLLAMEAFDRGHSTQSALWLALPAAVKIYPLGIAAAPLSIYLQRGLNKPAAALGSSTRYVIWFLIAVPILWLAVPALAYGGDTVSLNVSWWHGVILNNAQMDYLQSLRAISNQSLDTVLLRFLSYDPAFHDQYRAIPHLAIAKGTVLLLAHVVRVLLIAISAAAVWIGARRYCDRPASTGDLLAVTALWVATLYNIVPETKARYAVYLFIAMLPWLARAVDRAAPRGRRVAFGTAVIVCAVLTLVLLPDAMQACGVGFVGPFAIWIGNLRFVARRDAALHASTLAG